MYRTCVVHHPIPCTVMDERRLYFAHDRYLLEDDEATASQEDPDSPEDV